MSWGYQDWLGKKEEYDNSAWKYTYTHDDLKTAKEKLDRDRMAEIVEKLKAEERNRMEEDRVIQESRAAILRAYKKSREISNARVSPEDIPEELTFDDRNMILFLLRKEGLPEDITTLEEACTFFILKEI